MQHFADGVTDLYLQININRKFEPDVEKAIRAVIDAFKEAERLAAHKYERKFSAKLVVSFNRTDSANSPEKAAETTDKIIELRNRNEEFKNRIVGIDISGPEAIIDTTLNTHFSKTSDYKGILEKRHQKQKRKGKN